jgi:23S rRNA (adenine2030-N6)-methyltransferase
VWELLQVQHPALVYADSHAGRGIYDLSAPEAQKTREYETGIVQLSGQRFTGSLQAYKRAVEFWQPFYAGSPGCIAAHMRKSDRQILCELHPGEHGFLQRNMGSKKGVFILHKDGHEALLPAISRKAAGLVLIDPSYEVKTEYLRTAETALALREKCSHMVIMIWYPVLKGRDYFHALEEKVQSSKYGREAILSRFSPVDAPEKGMIESRLLLIGASKSFASEVEAVEKDLLQILSQGKEKA